MFLGDGATPAVGFTVYVGSYDRRTSAVAAVSQAVTDAAGSFAFDRILAGSYDVVAIDPATRQVGITGATVVAQITNSTNVVLEALGSVEGVVFDAQGHPAGGALVAGGLSLSQTDANGFFHIDGVPVGQRTLQAGDPVTKRTGSVQVTVLPGQTVRASVTLEARATIVGRVLDANGAPVPKATVRLVASGGFQFVFANNAGFFRFPDLSFGDYLLEAPGPPQEALIDFMRKNGIDPRTAFTFGDVPPELGGAPPPTAGDANAVLAAYQNAVQTFLSISDPRLVGLPASSIAGFGWSAARLFQDSTTVVANIKFLSQGSLSGVTVDGNGLPTAAIVRLNGLTVDGAGAPKFAELQRLTTDLVTGQFSFSGIPRFDLSTFQTTGIRAGDFSLAATNPSSPVVVQFAGQLNVDNPDQAGIMLKFPRAADTNGTITGTVFMPDGTTPAPENTEVRISFGDLTVRTDAQGKFRSQLPIPQGNYTLTALEPISGLQGQAFAIVPAGGNVDVRIRLLGLGAVSLTVKRADGRVVPNAIVSLERSGFPGGHADAVTGVNGVVRFVNLTEGPFSVTAVEQGTGLSGRASGTIVRDSEVSTLITIMAAGRVTGAFVAADGRTPIPNAQIVLSGAVRAFATTNNAGRFEMLVIPVGRFTVEGSDPLTGRVGRASGEVRFEGDTADVTIIEAPRGTVEGFVLQADQLTRVAGASISISSSGLAPISLQATSRNDGGFRFDGISAGSFSLSATDPVSGFQGQATGTLALDGETVSRNVILEGFGVLRVTVLDADGAPATNVQLTLSGPSGERQATVDPTGAFTFEFLKLGTYSLLARSLADAHDGGEATATVEKAGQTASATIHLRGIGAAEVTVVEADGITPVPSARVVLTSKASFGNDRPRPFGDSYVAFTNGSGLVRIDRIAVGDFFVTAEAGPLAGVSAGSIAAPGATSPVTVQLGASGSIVGRVLLPHDEGSYAARYASRLYPAAA